MEKTPETQLSPDEWKAHTAFQVWAALRRAAADEPELLGNPYYEALCWETHDEFQRAFARCS
tara:strand:- start:10925 stop:11110 length:186 start_codon:yes stop_codon:yes gene_type:complete